ncbi:MAG: amidase [Alphaproteobacteria bacterium]|jgi:amidase|nr:amidase [Alphaproteobacteria bacterium]
MIWQGATDLIEALDRRQVSSVELAERAITRIEACDGTINAVVVRDFERALAAARQADETRRRGGAGALLGLPVTVKECFDVAGLPTTWGVAGSEKSLAPEDAVVVQRLKAAGAVVLGKTNVPVMLTDWQAANPIYGVTSNPWNAARTSGGSSGGSAAALAAGFVALEVGSDLAGSIRVPAAFCGVYGHKPSYGLVPLRGASPPGAPRLSTMPAIDMAVAGPMARSAADLDLALDVLAGPDLDAAAYRLALPPARHRTLRDHRVLVLDHHPLVPLQAAIRTRLNAVADDLIRAGCTVGREAPGLPDLRMVARVFGRLLLSFAGADMPQQAYDEMRARASGTDDDPQTALTLSHRDWIVADRQRSWIRHLWRQVFGDWDIVLCPVTPTTAFPHDHRDQTVRTLAVDGREIPYNSQSIWCGIANMAGLPATALPAGLDADGLPIGLQAIGPHLEDRTTIAFVRLLAEAIGGFAPPPGY